MGQKIRPNSFRLGIVQDWDARWFAKRSFKDRLQEDELIRDIVKEKIAAAGIAKIEIERNANSYKVYIKAARPGLVIGRGGKGIEVLSMGIELALRKLLATRKDFDAKKKIALSLNVEELKRTEVSAANIGQTIAAELEKRMPFRRTMKKYMASAMQNRDVKGIKVRLSGRLDGAEIARREWLAQGKLPLQTLRADIDYAEETAFTIFGTVGIKVWIYKGDVFKKLEKKA